MALMMILTVLSASSATASTQVATGLSSCGASVYSATQGHSYCASGGTSGEQRVRLYCHYYSNAANWTITYGPWVVAGQWSEAKCPSLYVADQAQFVLSS